MNQEEMLAQRLGAALDGDLAIPEALSEEEQRVLEELLGTATFLQNQQQPPLDLGALSSDVTKAAQRSQRAQRLVWLSIVAAACLVLGLFQLGNRSPALEIRYPDVPTLREPFSPETSPLARLDPVYEAGLRGAREARYVGAYDATR